MYFIDKNLKKIFEIRALIIKILKANCHKKQGAFILYGTN